MEDLNNKKTTKTKKLLYNIEICHKFTFSEIFILNENNRFRS